MVVAAAPLGIPGPTRVRLGEALTEIAVGWTFAPLARNFKSS